MRTLLLKGLFSQSITVGSAEDRLVYPEGSAADRLVYQIYHRGLCCRHVSLPNPSQKTQLQTGKFYQIHHRETNSAAERMVLPVHHRRLCCRKVSLLNPSQRVVLQTG